MSRRKGRKIRTDPGQKLVGDYPAPGQSSAPFVPPAPDESNHSPQEAAPLTSGEEELRAYANVLSEALSQHSAKAIAQGLGLSSRSSIYKWQQGVREFPARYLGKLYALTRDRRPIDAALEGSGLMAIEPASPRRRDLQQLTLPRLTSRASEAVCALSEFLMRPSAHARDRARSELRLACETFEAAHRALQS